MYPNFFNHVFCSQSKSYPISTILMLFWLVISSLVFPPWVNFSFGVFLDSLCISQTIICYTVIYLLTRAVRVQKPGGQEYHMKQTWLHVVFLRDVKFESSGQVVTLRACEQVSRSTWNAKWECDLASLRIVVWTVINSSRVSVSLCVFVRRILRSRFSSCDKELNLYVKGTRVNLRVHGICGPVHLTLGLA